MSLRQNYIKTIKTASNKIEYKQKYHNLGLVDNSPKFYYEKGNSLGLATAFLKAFWSQPTYRDATIEAHHLKIQSQPNPSYNVACVSFITATLQSENNSEPARKYCFVAFSGCNSNPGLMAALSEFTVEFNDHYCDVNSEEEIIYNYHSSTVEYVLIGGEGFSEQDQFFKKKCAEAYYIELLYEMYRLFGQRFVIDGVSNLLFYPFEFGATYGLGAGSKDPLVSVKHLPDFMVDLGAFYSYEISCCQYCIMKKEERFDYLQEGQSSFDHSNSSTEENTAGNYVIGESTLKRRISFLFPSTSVAKIGKKNEEEKNSAYLSNENNNNASPFTKYSQARRT